MQLEKKILKYLEKYGWTAMDVGIALMKFKETHGEDKVKAMERFIEKAEADKDRFPDSMIAVTLGHDLKGCEDALMSPRTSSY